MTQRHGIYSVPLPVSGKKVAASVVTLAAICLLLPKKMRMCLEEYFFSILL